MKKKVKKRKKGQKGTLMCICILEKAHESGYKKCHGPRDLKNNDVPEGSIQNTKKKKKTVEQMDRILRRITGTTRMGGMKGFMGDYGSYKRKKTKRKKLEGVGRN